MVRTNALCGLLSVSILVFATAAGAVPRFDPLILDLNGDGFDLSNVVTTGLVSDDAATLRWTQGGSDDAFLVLDATSLRAAGIDVSNGRAEALEGNVLFRDGLRITKPGGTTAVVTDGWNILGIFDDSGDGAISSDDPVWLHLRLFTDDDADGLMGGDEVFALSRDILKTFFETGDIPTEDQYGNRYAPGSYVLEDDSTGAMASVQLQPVPEPGSLALAGLGLAWLGSRRARRGGRAPRLGSR